MMECNKFPVRFLANLLADDLRTIPGRTIANLAISCGLPCTDRIHLTASLIKKKIVYKDVEEEDMCKVTFAKKMLDMRDKEIPYVRGFSETHKLEKYLITFVLHKTYLT